MNIFCFDLHTYRRLFVSILTSLFLFPIGGCERFGPDTMGTPPSDSLIQSGRPANMLLNPLRNGQGEYFNQNGYGHG